jgi:hypothetical protein
MGLDPSQQDPGETSLETSDSFLLIPREVCAGTILDNCLLFEYLLLQQELIGGLHAHGTEYFGSIKSFSSGVREEKEWSGSPTWTVAPLPLGAISMTCLCHGSEIPLIQQWNY